MASSAAVQVFDNDQGGNITFTATNNSEESLFLKIDIAGKNITQQSWLREIEVGQSKELGTVRRIETDKAYTYTYRFTSTPLKPFSNPPEIEGPTFAIPYYLQLEGLNCGPTCVQMIHNFFQKENKIDASTTVQNIAALGCSWPNTYSWPMELGLAATKLGYEVEVYGTKYLFRGKNFEQSKEECASLNVPKNVEHIDLQDILDKLNENCLAITLLNWNKLIQLMSNGAENQSYAGHYVCISGYDNENVYVHNQGKGSIGGKYAGPYVPIPRPLFEAARVDRTGEGVIFIKNN